MKEFAMHNIPLLADDSYSAQGSIYFVILFCVSVRADHPPLIALIAIISNGSGAIQSPLLRSGRRHNALTAESQSSQSVSLFD